MVGRSVRQVQAEMERGWEEVVGRSVRRVQAEMVRG